MVNFMAVGAADYPGQNSMDRPWQIQARMCLAKQVRDNNVVQQSTHLVLWQATKQRQILDYDVHNDLQEAIHQRMVHHVLSLDVLVLG